MDLHMKIAIIDKLGLCYDGTTLSKQGLGGSESAVILMSKELAKLGFTVTVYNNCIDTKSSPGVYDGVTYIDHTQTHTDTYDIIISSRSVFPFSSTDQYANMCASAKYKILWMHDTFCQGDEHIENMLVNGYIDEVFTLSDFHSAYVTNCNHGSKRNFEVLKHKFFQTRNGAVKHIAEVNLTKKDRNHFVYNASATKGLIPLVKTIWPEIKKQLPDAHLTCIGGYYRFREGAAPDAQEKTVAELVNDPKLKALDVTFTGVIPQHKIAEILANASLMLYPTDFPETFGISTLESLLYNTPLVTNTFGALEETAVDLACYKIPYSSKRNNLFPNVNEVDQAQKFIKATIDAYNDPYLLQQKQNYCDVVNDIYGWDTVALQWKQHLFGKLNIPLPVHEYRSVSRINNKVSRVYGRRFNNEDDRKVYTSYGKQRRIVVISPFWNAENYIDSHIRSVAQQDYSNYLHILINDNSEDNSKQVVKRTLDDVKTYSAVVRNKETNNGAIFNQLTTVHEFVDDDDIVVLLDGDDWLVNNNTIFHYYNDLYNQGYEFTYGSMWSLADNIPLVSQEYPQSVKHKREYRQHLFNWKIPYTHLRTVLGKHIKNLDESKFKDASGNWMKSGHDNPLFYELIEQVDSDRIYCNREIICNYNDLNPLNDYKVRSEEQNKNASLSYTQTNKFSVIVPTMWRCQDLFERSLNSFISHKLIDEIIIIDNDINATPAWDILLHPKVKMYKQETNIKVNPAWNLGVEVSKNKLICIVNDDIEFDTKLFDKMQSELTTEVGAYGIIVGDPALGQPITTDKSIDFKQWNPGDIIHCFGQLMFIHKDNWIPIIDGLNLFFGDDFIFHTQLMAKRNNYLIYNIDFNTPFSATTSDPAVYEGTENERSIFEKWFNDNPITEKHIKKESSIAVPNKRILIAVPTNKYIEPETMKSIYDLILPEGYTPDFQFFYGYQVDQIRNLIADWAKHYDFLFSVDSDIVLPNDCLVKMLAANKDAISGLYIQRKTDQHILEVYQDNPHGGVVNIPFSSINGLGIIPVASFGFGCVLIKSEIFRTMEYPHFYYRSAIDHKDTISEDIYFCQKARSMGFTLWADTSIQCEHIGTTKFVVEQPKTKSSIEHIHEQDLLPKEHIEYLKKIKATPSVVYDIGACVMHWTRHAKHNWPDATYVLFDAEPNVEQILSKSGDRYHIGVLTDTDNKELKFYHNPDHPGGNSYYQETTGAFTEKHAEIMTGMTLDTIVSRNNYPLPDLIKMDIQGAELDVLRGATNTLKNVKDIILEAQHVDYNNGAPQALQVIQYMSTLGFELIGNFSRGPVDSDYHFKRKT